MLLQDPFVSVSLCGDKQQTLPTISGGIAPVWSSAENNVLHLQPLDDTWMEAGQSIVFQIWNQNAIVDDLIGQLRLDLHDLVIQQKLNSDRPMAFDIDTGGKLECLISCKSLALHTCSIDLSKTKAGSFGLRFRRALITAGQKSGCCIQQFSDSDAGDLIKDTGMLKVGDRLAQLDHEPVLNLTWKDVASRLQYLPVETPVQFEFLRVVIPTESQISEVKNVALSSSSAMPTITEDKDDDSGSDEHASGGVNTTIAESGDESAEKFLGFRKLSTFLRPDVVSELSEGRRSRVVRTMPVSPVKYQPQPVQLGSTTYDNLVVTAHCATGITDISTIGDQVLIFVLNST